MKKIVLLATILHASFVQDSGAKGMFFDISNSCPMAHIETGEMGLCDDLSDPTELVDQLNGMSLEDAHNHLSHSGYSVAQLRKAFQAAHALDCPMAVVNIAHHLGFMDMYQRGDRLSQLMKMRTESGVSSKRLDLKQLKRDLAESYKSHLPKNTSVETADDFARMIVTYMKRLPKVNKAWKYNGNLPVEEYTVSIIIKPEEGAQEHLGLSSSSDIKRYVKGLQKWDIS